MTLIDEKNELPESIKIKMLEDAGFIPTELQERYLKLIEFVKRISQKTCTICCAYCISCDAVRLLQEFGES